MGSKPGSGRSAFWQISGVGGVGGGGGGGGVFLAGGWLGGSGCGVCVLGLFVSWGVWGFVPSKKFSKSS